MTLELRQPTRELAASFAEMRDACLAAGEDHWHPPDGEPLTEVAHTDVGAYIDLLNGWTTGETLPEGWTPRDPYWIVKDGIVVGELNIRHRLTENLRQIGGHIGYHVHPKYRNQGIATFAVQEAVKLVALLGESEMLITCADDNAASARVVEKCGGVRIADSTLEGYAKRRRYVIQNLPRLAREEPS
ncbi:MAG TPA: GNAT family N-acetyltransferase [Candidatus Cybelea sp.]|jgi:predicted acetyltransferase